MDIQKTKETKVNYLEGIYGKYFNLPGFAFLRKIAETHLSLVQFVVNVKYEKASNQDPVIIHVSLEDSLVSSGGLCFNNDDGRGYFQDKIKVSINLVEQPDLIRISDGPETQNGSSHTSSSVSVSFGEHGNVGFFGGTPTGGVGANVGVSDTHSFTRDLNDFTVINNSGSHNVSHEYLMTASSKGAYKKPTDLVVGPGLSEAFEGIKLAEPPPLAVSNFPIISQAIWRANHNEDINKNVRLSIKIEQHITFVVGSNKFFTIHKESHSNWITHPYDMDIPLYRLIGQQGDRL